VNLNCPYQYREQPQGLPHPGVQVPPGEPVQTLTKQQVSGLQG
jgi:hypothetical protein